MREGIKIASIAMVTMISMTIIVSYAALADTFSGGSYKVDASVMNNFGNRSTSTSYAMVSSGGESVIGNGAGGSYFLSQGYSSQLNKSLQMSIQPTGLVAYYPFDETQGPTAYDWTTNNNNATRVLGNPFWTTGTTNGAIDIQTTGGYFQSSTSPLASVGSFTIEGWFYPYSTSNNMILAAQDNFSGTGDKWNIAVNASGGLTFNVQKSGAVTSAVGSTVMTTNAWHHVLATYDGSTITLYLDGAMTAQAADSAGTLAFTFPIAIGARNIPASPNLFGGKVDEIRVYNRGMTPNEVKNHYGGQNLLAQPGFVYVGDVTPGTSSSVLSDAVVQTDAPGYNLSALQLTNLTGNASGSEIAPISGTIASPSAWVEGTTKGLGFTLTSAPSLDPKWGTSPNFKYAALPDSTTTFYTRSGGYTGGAKDVIRMQYRVDANTSQVADYYQNVVILKGTMIP